MRKKVIGSTLLILCILLFSGCNNVEPKEPLENDKVEVNTVSENQGPLNLTQEQMVEDFNYLYSTMIENYPTFGVAKRLYGVDWPANKDKYLEDIKACKTDKEFYLVIENILGDLQNAGHLYLHSPTSYFYHIMNHSAGDRTVEFYKAVIETPEVGKKYLAWSKIIDSTDSDESPEEAKMVKFPDSHNIVEDHFKAKYIDEGITAYLRLPSFYINAKMQSDDNESLSDFYRSIKDYSNLIIDVRQNGGGFDAYWHNYVVSPLSKEKAALFSYDAYKSGDIVAKYQAFMRNAKNNLDTLPEGLDYPEELKSDFLHFKIAKKTIPASSLGFEGNIYILVDEGVYSSAENFVQFAKTSQWATLVGTTTGGDGINSSYVLYHLPNSGLIVQYSASLALRPDGRSSEEFGTDPDIVISEDEDALEKALEIIGAKK